jgi:hypothetical protein
VSPRALALLLFVIGVAMAWAITSAPLPGLSPDSASYLGAAELLARGEGLRIPMAKWWSDSDSEPLRHFPPAFPLLIALPTALGAAAVASARVIEALSFGAMLSLAALTAMRASASVWGGAIAGAMLLLTPAIVQDFMPVLSEPLFLCLVALLLYLLAASRERPLLLGLISAAAVLVRYAGISLTATCVLLCLIEPGSLWTRVRRALLAGAPTLVAMVVWKRVSGDFRKYGMHAEGLPDEFARAWQTLASWLAPGVPEGLVRLTLVGAALVGCALLAARVLRRELPQLQRLAWTVAVFAFAYTGVIVSARSFADPAIEFDWRTLSPLMLVGTTAFAALLAVQLGGLESRKRWALGALLGGWLAGGAADIERMVRRAHVEGYSYESPAWQSSAVARWLRKEGAGFSLYTNNPAALWHLGQRKSRMLPTREDLTTMPAATVLARGPCAIVQFPHSLVDALPADALAREFGFTPVLRSPRGTVWVGGKLERPASVARP